MDNDYTVDNWKAIYERRMEELKKEINIRPSSPEAVILENVTGLTSMQLERIKRIAGGMEEKLINLAGFYRERKHTERIFVKAYGVEESFLIPACQKFMAGNLCFESEESREISGTELIGIYAGEAENIRDFSYLLEDKGYTDGEIFGSSPSEGMELYLVFDSIPMLDTELTIYAECKKNEINLRTEYTQGEGTRIEWELYTQGGYEGIECIDNTKNFNKSGSITFNVKSAGAEKIRLKPDVRQGYVIRGTLSSASYNVCPEIKSVKGLVYPLVQRDTRSHIYTFKGQKECYVYSDLMEEQYVRVYCRRYGESLYHRCSEREYEEIRQGYGRYRISFDEIYESIAVAVYSKEAASVCDIGYVYGYDNEEFDLRFSDIAGGCFCVIAQAEEKNGEPVYDFVKPKIPGVMGFSYELDEKEGRLRVISAGEYKELRLYMGEAATETVAEGMLLKGTELIPSGYDTGVKFINAADTSYGGREESLTELKKRFAADVYKSYTAVTKKDYEDIVMGIEGINAAKVRAVGNASENKVSIAVYIKGMKPGERLSDMAKRIIRKELNKRRLLSTGIVLVSPVFACVNVNAVIAVKRHYEHCENQIREAIERLTDYINGEKSFGEPLILEEVYREIQSLKCVSYIVSFDMLPGSYTNVSVSGSDIRPFDNCLLIPGNIQLTLNYENDGF